MNNRKRLQWKIRGRELQLGERTLMMGVLNVTPDSFSDGGKFSDPDRAFAHAVEMEEAGADIIDIGAESTRPGSPRISEAEELRRLIPVLKRLQKKLSVPVSVDTYKSAVAEKAMEHGVEIINDPSGLTFDPHLARMAANHDAGLILNHMRGHAGIVGQAAAAYRRAGHDLRGSAGMRAPRGAIRRGPHPHCGRSGPGIREAQGAKFRDPGALARTGRSWNCRY